MFIVIDVWVETPEPEIKTIPQDVEIVAEYAASFDSREPALDYAHYQNSPYTNVFGRPAIAKSIVVEVPDRCSL